MINQIFVNLPVKDLNKTKKFFSELGFKFNPQFTDENAACMIIGKNMFAMLLLEKFFKTFVKKEISDAKKSTEVITALQVENKKEVDELVSKAIKSGGTKANDKYDYGWMYGMSFYDIDGHMWEVFHMDESKFPKKENDKTITIEVNMKATVNKVWEFFTEPKHITKWNFASNDWECPKAKNDLKAGGKFNYLMSAKDKKTSFNFEGVYTAVEKHKLIEYKMSDGRKVSIKFIPQNNIIKIIETFEIENENPKEMQKQGWQSILNNFKKYVESQK